MREYTVYFELYGKKMKTEIFAKDKNDAMMKIRQKITFHKISETKSNKDDVFDNIMNLFNMK